MRPVSHDGRLLDRLGRGRCRRSLLRRRRDRHRRLIRVPAAFCGGVGLKPTFGRVPYEGIVETTSRTMCHAGPLGRSVEDAALLFDAIAAADTARSLAGGDVRRLRLAVAEHQSSESLDEDVEAALDEAARVFEVLGVDLVDVAIRDLLWPGPRSGRSHRPRRRRSTTAGSRPGRATTTRWSASGSSAAQP